MPRAKLPTNVNQALVIFGAHFAVNESGYLCAYDPIRKDWIVHTGTQIPDLGWFRVLVHRNHAGKICNVYLDMTNDGIENGPLVFPNLPIYGPDLDLFIRISFSSVGDECRRIRPQDRRHGWLSLGSASVNPVLCAVTAQRNGLHLDFEASAIFPDQRIARSAHSADPDYQSASGESEDWV